MSPADRVSKSFVYRSPRIYNATMRLLYGRSLREGNEEIGALIPDGATVLDVCCGTAALYADCLARRRVTYTGLDINRAFVADAQSRGIHVIACDIRNAGELPGADTVVMQNSLYQFHPDCAGVVERLVGAAGARVILAEPVRNWGASPNPVLRRIALRGTDPGTGRTPFRFDERSLDALLGSRRVALRKPIRGGRDMLYVLEAGAGAVRREGA